MIEVLISTAIFTAIILTLTLLVIAARAIFVPTRVVTITVNDTTRVQGKTGEKLLVALKAGGLHVPSACAGAGTCGLCRVRLTDGAEPPLATERARLGAAELRDGMRLACQTVVRGPLSVAVPQEVLAAQVMLCDVVSARMLAPLVRELVLSVPSGAPFDPRPGAFVQVTAMPYNLDFTQIEVNPDYRDIWDRLGWRNLSAGTNAPTTRAYSIANTPADTGRIVLVVRLALPPPTEAEKVPPGIVSSFLFGLKPGAQVHVTGPFGEFAARESGNEMVLIGGGVGMAPLRAIIHDQLTRKNTTRRISYWYGARSEIDAFFSEEFRDLARTHGNFSFHLALSESESGLSGRSHIGFVHEVAFENYLKDHPAPENCEYYLCGPPLMIEAVSAMLDALGVPEEMIFFDDFGG